AGIARIAADPSRSETVRESAIKAMAPERPAELLQLIEDGKLTDGLKAVAVNLLLTSHDESVRKAATAMKSSTVSLPPIEELAKRRGDPMNGKKVFNTACAACHLPSPLNIDFGPNLSLIGDKLPRSEMYVAILDPGAGVSFGYETTTVTLRDNTPMVGFLVSETDDKVALKFAGGVVQEFSRSKIKSIKQTKESLMPKGLEQVMSEQGLVDVVEYMVSLKKK
ncbi:MAG: dehydrogenase, partial [Verrucomicrobiota bacterium]